MNQGAISKAFLTIALVLTWSLTAHAVIIEHTRSQPLVDTDWLVEFNDIPQFNPALGTLNSVQIIFSSRMESDMLVDNDADEAIITTGTVFVDLTAAFTGLGLQLVNRPEDSTGTLLLAADDSSPPPGSDTPGDGGPDEADVTGLNGVDSSVLNPIVMAPFIGVGNLTVAMEALAGFSVSGGGGNVDVVIDTGAQADVTVVYDYDTEVGPECGDGTIDPGEECGEPGLACDPEFYCVNCTCQDLIPVELLYLHADPIAGGIEITWATATEIDNAGFNILRSEDENGEYIQINQALIPAEGGPSWGAEYSYEDNDVQTGTTYWYKLEDVDILGAGDLHGPVSATLQGFCGAMPSRTTDPFTAFGFMLIMMFPVLGSLFLRRLKN